MARRIGALALLALIAAPLLYAPPASGEEAVYRPGDVFETIVVEGTVLGLAWSPDGERLAVSVGVEWELRVYDLAGGLVSKMTFPNAPGPLAWSPDGSKLAVGVGSEMWLVDPASGAVFVKRRYDYRVLDVAWSPDGSMLAVANAGGEVYVYDAGGNQLYVFPKANPPATSVAWSADSAWLIVGDGLGFVYTVNAKRPLDYQATGPLPGRVVGIAVNPRYETVAVSTNETTIFYQVLSNGSLRRVIDTGVPAEGKPSWSPCGYALAVPRVDRVTFIDYTGIAYAEAYTPDRYAALYAAWNPARYSVLAAGGRDLASSQSGVYYFYVGGFLIVHAEPPVYTVCYAGTCSSRLEVDAWERPVAVELQVVLDEYGGGPGNYTLRALLSPPPMTVLEAWGADILSGAAGRLEVPGGKGLIVVLRDPQARVEVEGPDGSVHVLQSLGVLVEPSRYRVTVSLEEPPGWLGPEWELTRRMLVEVGPGQARILNYTGFTIEAVTASLYVEAEPGSYLELRFPNDTVVDVVESGQEAYTVPADSFIARIALPEGPRVLVENKGILARDYPLVLYPGDQATITFHYLDVLGEMRILAPAGSRILVTPPWQAAPAWTARVPEAGPGEERLLAQPGVYLVEAELSAPEGWLGPEPPRATVNASVEAGATVTVDLVHLPSVQEWLQLLASSATVHVAAPADLTVRVTGPGGLEARLPGGNHTLILPPGNYTLQLVDEAAKRILDEEKLTVEGPGEHTIVLEKPAPPPTTQQAAAPETRERSIPRAAIIAVLVAIPAVAGVAAYLVFFRRRRAAPATGYW